MSRKRYISTDISRDSAVNRMAEKYGDFAALLYTWMIPHAEDDACIRGDVEELMADVIPRLRQKTVEDVVTALNAMNEFGLIQWDSDNKIIYFPVGSFYKHQKYIKDARRRTEDVSLLRNSAKNAEVLGNTQKDVEVRGSSAQLLASLSLTHSLSHSHPHSQTKESGGGETRESSKGIVRYYENTYGRLPNNVEVDELMEFVNKGMELELVYEAIKKARLANKDMRFAKGILKNQFTRNILTVVQAQADDAEHDAVVMSSSRREPKPQSKSVYTDENMLQLEDRFFK